MTPIHLAAIDEFKNAYNVEFLGLAVEFLTPKELLRAKLHELSAQLTAEEPDTGQAPRRRQR